MKRIHKEDKMRRKLSKPSPALIVAFIALFVAMSGTGYAAITLQKNSVGAKQIKKSAVRSSDVKNRSLKALDFRPGELPAGEQGPQGPQGPQGAPGAPGQDGQDGEDGSAVAYASIEADGDILPDHTLNVSNVEVRNPETGVYCFRDPTGDVRSALAAAENAGAFNDTVVSVTTRTPSTILADCFVDEIVRVRTFDVSSGALADRPFSIWFEN